jgi:UDP-N-acetyl-D-glucosamine dehydrogenase
MSLQKIKNDITQKKCIIEVFGIGYVGFPLSIRLASSNFNVIGVEKNDRRLKRLESNLLKRSENNFKSQFINLRKKKKLSFSQSSTKSKLTRIGIICVPTPISSKKTHSNIFVISAVKDFLSKSKKGDSLIIESSLELGSFKTIKSIIRKKGFLVGIDFGLAYCPERIDPLNKKWNIHNIPRVIYCEGDATFEITKMVYHGINRSNLIRVSSSNVAEIVKSFENSFRLVNISLVNELAILCDKLKIDIFEVLNAAATKPFGFIPFYSGAGAGGHCIPKDSISLYTSAKKIDFDFSMVKQALIINELIPKYIVNNIKKTLKMRKLIKKVLVIGLAYKSDIEDLRDSPGLKIVSLLRDSSFDVEVFDPFFDKRFLEEELQKHNISNTIVLENLDIQKLDKLSCMILVQHHTKLEKIIQNIYDKSLVPVIYDCQSRLKHNSNSSTVLESFG